MVAVGRVCAVCTQLKEHMRNIASLITCQTTRGYTEAIDTSYCQVELVLLHLPNNLACAVSLLHCVTVYRDGNV